MSPLRRVSRYNGPRCPVYIGPPAKWYGSLPRPAKLLIPLDSRDTRASSADNAGEVALVIEGDRYTPGMPTTDLGSSMGDDPRQTVSSASNSRPATSSATPQPVSRVSLSGRSVSSRDPCSESLDYRILCQACLEPKRKIEPQSPVSPTGSSREISERPSSPLHSHPFGACFAQ
jgi:hypothetical protein